MVSIQKDFNDSFQLLTHHKKIILPVLLSILVPFILIILFLHLSGVYPLLQEISEHAANFEKQKIDYLANPDNTKDSRYTKELLTYATKDSDDSQYSKEFGEYLDKQGVSEKPFLTLVTINNLILLIVFLLIGIISSLYFSNMSNAVISLLIKKQPLTFDSVIQVTNKYFFKLISLNMILFFIFVGPVIIFIIIAASLFLINALAGALSIILFVILFIAYIIYMSLRLIFATPIMYIDEESSLRSVKHGYALTKGHLRQVLLLFTIIYGLTLFSNSFVAEPMYSTFSGIVLDPSYIRAALNFVFIVLFLTLEAFLFTFEHLFLFYTYTDFKQLKEEKQ